MEDSCIACKELISYSQLCAMCHRRINKEKKEFCKLREDYQSLQNENFKLQESIQDSYIEKKRLIDKKAKYNRLKRLVKEQEELISTTLAINEVENSELSVLQMKIKDKQHELELADFKLQQSREELTTVRCKDLSEDIRNLNEHQLKLQRHKQSLVRQLCEIFNVQWNGKDVTILGKIIPIYLPLTSGNDIGCVLGHFCKFFSTLAYYLDTPLLYTIRCKGSLSTIQLGKNEFPLFGSNSEDLKKAISLLHKNIEHFCFSHGYVIQDPSDSLITLLSVINSPQLGLEPPYDFKTNLARVQVEKSKHSQTSTDTFSDWVTIDG